MVGTSGSGEELVDKYVPESSDLIARVLEQK
jgi:hypothetical protein